MADGLHYLHSSNIVHGDLKGVRHSILCLELFQSQTLTPTNSKANILIDGEGRARLTDFGLTSIIRGEKSLVSAQDSTVANATTWAAPEILGGGPISKEGDIFTFAMVAVEVRPRELPTAFHVSQFPYFNTDVQGQPSIRSQLSRRHIRDLEWGAPRATGGATSRRVMGHHEQMLEQGTKGAADHLPAARLLPNLVSFSLPASGG